MNALLWAAWFGQQAAMEALCNGGALVKAENKVQYMGLGRGSVGWSGVGRSGEGRLKSGCVGATGETCILAAPTGHHGRHRDQTQQRALEAALLVPEAYWPGATPARPGGRPQLRGPVTCRRAPERAHDGSKR